MPLEEEEGRYGFGTTAAIDSFIKSMPQYTPDTQFILAINIGTLLRNSISKFTVIDGKTYENKETHGLNASATVANVRDTMVDMANEIASICSRNFPNSQHHILYYLTDNTKQVPSDWLRSQTSESAIRLNIATVAFMRAAKSVDQTNNNVQMHIRLADKMRVPSYKGIADVLNGFATYRTKVHMISHSPLDYHIKHYSGREGFLYRSHTGEIVPLTPSGLSKTVFRDENIPFYPATHVLLGDKYIVKGCLGKKDKTRFVELATSNRWALRTQDYILEKIKENNFVLPYSL